MYRNFSDKELSCPCCGQNKMDYGFMNKLVAMREQLGFPFKITSAYRCVNHNRAVGGSSGSAHLQGRAVDIQVSGEKAFKIITAAQEYSMTGIGVSQKGDHTARFIHLDNLETGLRPTVWSY